ncbi:MAG: HAD-IIIA family hydrolase [Rhodobacter sp.]|jgi:D-glycero-D-manno-heptose 1,7-bisphosphate phosphatase|nr:HAD-IIIA family hydrolase [Rhodobacter sp.]
MKLAGAPFASPPSLAYARLISPLPLGHPRRKGLFLDRDGVINEDTGYLSRIEDLRIRPGIAQRIGAARTQGQQTVIVTNQSGIGRGYYGWDAFEALQTEICGRLAAEVPEALISMVCACPFHPDAAAPYDVADHPWRKPNPGMIRFAAQVLEIDLENSLLIGDSASDEAAARQTGLLFEYA